MKICVQCLTLQGDQVETCPTCGSGLVPYGLWRKNHPTAASDIPAPPYGIPAAGPLAYVRRDIPTAADRPRHNGVDIVLGVFLSSLAFFIAFLAAYIFVELKK